MPRSMIEGEAPLLAYPDPALALVALDPPDEADPPVGGAG